MFMRKTVLKVVLIFLALLLCKNNKVTAQSIYQAPRLQVELVSEYTKINLKKEFLVAVVIKLAPDCFVFWQNPGDSGRPFQIDFILPAGFKASPLIWPVPQRIIRTGFANYGYKQQALILARITPPLKYSRSRQIKILADCKWMVSRKKAKWGKALLSCPLTIGRKNISTAAQPQLQKQYEKRPRPLEAFSYWQISGERHPRFIRLDIRNNLPKFPKIRDMDFYALTQGLVRTIAAPHLRQTKSSYTLRIPLKTSMNKAMILKGVLTARPGWDPSGKVQAVKVKIPLKVISKPQNFFAQRVLIVITALSCTFLLIFFIRRLMLAKKGYYD
jgi:thiol:disulfide interchange protein DsbD